MRRRYENCKHFNGIQNKICKAGINMRELAGGDDSGWTKRLPCLPNNPDKVECLKFELRSQEEIDAEEKDFEEARGRMREVGPIVDQIKKEHKGESWGGIVECPWCQGKLHLSHAAVNGHVWGQCETKGCLNWME